MNIRFQPNTLYYGDCLDILRDFPSDRVDLICLDPPFNSNANYHTIFALLRACRSLDSETYKADALLAIEGSLPKELIPVRNTLGIWVESVEVKGSD